MGNLEIRRLGKTQLDKAQKKSVCFAKISFNISEYKNWLAMRFDPAVQYIRRTGLLSQ